MKVDVAVAVHGKPWQTASTLFSLLEHSGRHIDKIWFHEEPKHVNNDGVDFVLPWFADKLVHFKPPLFLGYEKLTPTIMRRVRNDPDYRRSIRYQIPFEDTEKRFLLFCHNDTFFTGDVVGEMLKRLENSPYVGIGMIGQCWNCPAHAAGVCDGARHESFNPSYSEAIALVKKYPMPRTRASHFSRWKRNFMPECRLNEFACMLDLDKCRPLVFPKGDVAPLGLFAEDTGTKFFQDMRRRGERFLHYPEHFHHGRFAPNASGNALEHASQIDNYRLAEELAKQYCLEHYQSRMVDRSAAPAGAA